MWAGQSVRATVALDSVPHPLRRNELLARLTGSLEAPCQEASDPQADVPPLTTQHGSPPAPTLSGGPAGDSRLWAVAGGRRGGPLPACIPELLPATPYSPVFTDSRGRQPLSAPVGPASSELPRVCGYLPSCPALAATGVTERPRLLSGNTALRDQDFFSGRA